MLREAERLGREHEVGNVEWIRGSAHDLPPLGPFDLVTIGTAFHFMEPVATLSALRELTRDGGAVVIAYNGSPMWLHRDPWARALRGVLEEWFGSLEDVDVAVEGVRAADTAMCQLGYSDVERWERAYEDEIDADFVVGHIFSALSPDQLEHSRRPDLAVQIRERLPAGTFVELVPVRAVSGRP
jgi:methyltransferase family protein